MTLLPLVTEGDLIQDRALSASGGKALFIKELEQAIEAGEADVAVHSMKDVPAALPPGFAIGAVLERGDPCDAFVSNDHVALEALPNVARLGTSSLRRQCQLLRLRPDLAIVMLRGNVETRLRKLDERQVDATILAAAGLERLGLAARMRERLSPHRMMPAVGQGVIGVECQEGDARVGGLLVALEHPGTRRRLDAERAFAGRLGGSCQSPIAGHAELDGGSLLLTGFVGAPDGSSAFEDRIEGPAGDGAALGRQLAERLLAAGAEALLRSLGADPR